MSCLGKMSRDNSPAVCVWNVRRETQKFLLPNTSFCPFRWFEKVAVSQGLVYGLLNRRCLLVWDAESGLAKFRVDLAESPPGLSEPKTTFSYLGVYKNLVATICKNISSQIVYQIDPETPRVDVVMPKINLNYVNSTLTGSSENMRVCDVKINEHCVILHTYCVNRKSFGALIIRLDEQPMDDNDFLYCAQRCSFSLDSIDDKTPGILAITPTKLLNATREELCMLDFLN